jgi:hypothetical protein
MTCHNICEDRDQGIKHLLIREILTGQIPGKKQGGIHIEKNPVFPDKIPPPEKHPQEQKYFSGD